MFWQNLESDERLSSVLSVKDLSRHIPILPTEVIEYLECRKGRNYLDLTLGGGGHSEAILNATTPDGKVIGVDRDPDAIKRSRMRLLNYGERFQAVHGSLGKLSEVFESFSLGLNGALIDCGISSNQLEEVGRGFSFQTEGPLDMRMDPSVGFTAYEFLWTATEKEIADTIYLYGQERHSRRIARAIVAARKNNHLKTTKDLAEIVRRAVPQGARYGRIHAATRTFQAIRILVNDEINQLKSGLRFLLDHLPVGSRLVVISFHSLEDQPVKEIFRNKAREGSVTLLTKKPVCPSESEVKSNPRARSAKLRAVEISGAKS